MQNFNPSAQPAAEAQNSVPNTQEPKVPKSADSKGVKSSSATDKMCFRCKQPGHLKKNRPEPPYCSKCRTRGQVIAKCPLKNQDKQMKDVKATKELPKSMKVVGRTGRRHKTSHSSQTQIIDVSTVQATTEPMTAQ